MIANRINVKIFLAKETAVNPADWVLRFHRWIQDAAVPGFLIDVADYRHVSDGPGVLLMGQDVDYGLDLADGRPGLMVRCKRQWDSDSLAERTRAALTKARQAGDRLAADGIQLNAGEVTLTFPDRLHLPNTVAVWDEIKPQLAAVGRDWLGEEPVVTRVQLDERRPLTARIHRGGQP